MNEKELREIEARIAEELFGWKWLTFPRRPSPELATFSPPEWAETRLAKYALIALDEVPAIDRRYCDWDAKLPRYARDIAAAMEAAEKMRERWQGSEAWWFGEMFSAQGWRAVIVQVTEDNEEWLFEGQGLTLPEAIARCIVAALDAEVKG